MLLTAERIIFDGYAYANAGIEISDDGRIVVVAPLSELGQPDIHLERRVLVPGMVNAHSHSFQRLLRGRTQFAGPSDDNFWTWRDTMYHVANALDPTTLYTVARQAFIEMMLQGVTSVGEFHYLHFQPDGEPYDNPNIMARSLVDAARDVGLRISVLSAVYLHGGFDQPVSAFQKRFCDKSVDDASDRFDKLVHDLLEYRDPRIAWGIAAHSIRAVKLEEIMSLKLRLSHMPFHLHVSEQESEVEGCIKKYGARPVELLAKRRLIDSCSTLVHATHVNAEEIQAIAHAGALVCVCPSTEADLGDGLIPAQDYFKAGVGLCFGTDDHTRMSILEEARLFEMHERLRVKKRNIIAERENDSVAARLFEMASLNGARSLGIETGALNGGKWADFVTYDLDDLALTGFDDWSLLPSLMFSADARALRDVIVGGQFVVRDGVHPLAKQSRQDYEALSNSLFAGQ